MKAIAAAVVTLIGAGPALAGGPVTVEPEPVVATTVQPVVPTSPDWSGFYAGAQLGYVDVDSNDAGLDGNGAIGGVHAGYRWDFGRLVAGTEIDWDASNANLGDDDVGSLDNVARLKLVGGTEIGQRGLLYATAGAAYADASVADTDLSDNGYFFGAGMDFAVNERWTVGGEVLRHNFDDFDDSGVDLDATTAKVKVALRF